MNLYLALPQDLPSGFVYPEAFLNFVSAAEIDLAPWKILPAKKQVSLAQDLADRYPQRKLLPFAKRTDCDDVAAWELDKQDEVIILHDFADEGWELRERFDDFDGWLKRALSDKREWEATS